MNHLVSYMVGGGGRHWFTVDFLYCIYKRLHVLYLLVFFMWSPSMHLFYVCTVSGIVYIMFWNSVHAYENPSFLLCSEESLLRIVLTINFQYNLLKVYYINFYKFPFICLRFLCVLLQQHSITMCDPDYYCEMVLYKWFVHCAVAVGVSTDCGWMVTSITDALSPASHMTMTYLLLLKTSWYNASKCGNSSEYSIGGFRVRRGLLLCCPRDLPQ